MAKSSGLWQNPWILPLITSMGFAMVPWKSPLHGEIHILWFLPWYMAFTICNGFSHRIPKSHLDERCETNVLLSIIRKHQEPQNYISLTLTPAKDPTPGLNVDICSRLRQNRKNIKNLSFEPKTYNVIASQVYLYNWSQWFISFWAWMQTPA